MSVRSEERSLLQWLHHRKPASSELTSMNADRFVEIRASHIPWDEDAPIVREDEHYELLKHDAEFPSETAVHPWLVRPRSS